MKSPLKPRPKGPGEVPGQEVCPLSHARQGGRFCCLLVPSSNQLLLEWSHGAHKEGKQSGFQFITKSKIPASWQGTRPDQFMSQVQKQCFINTDRPEGFNKQRFFYYNIFSIFPLLINGLWQKNMAADSLQKPRKRLWSRAASDHTAFNTQLLSRQQNRVQQHSKAIPKPYPTEGHNRNIF